MSTLTAVDTSTQCKITNNSNLPTSTNTAPAGYDIVVGMPINSDIEKDNSPGALLSSTKNFEVITLADGKSTVITKGSSGTVTLDRTITDDSGTNYEYAYDLVISSAGWYIPLANISVMQNLFPAGYDPITLTADDFDGMKQTQDFYQIISAFPNSTLAVNYANSMTKTSSDADSKADGSDGSVQAVSDTIAAGEAAFFQKTQGYKKVTADQICLLEFYYRNFPFVWANYGSATYYIYSNSDDGATTTFAGTLNLTKPATVDITLPNGGYTISFNPAVNPADLTKTDVDSTQAKSLVFADGLFSEANTDNSSVSLKGMFGLKRTFTKNTADQTVIVIMAGTINGLKSMGFDETQAKKADDSTQDWLNSLFHPTTAAGIFNSVMTILGALMMLHFVATTLFGIGKWIKSKLSGPTPKNSVTSDEFQQVKKQLADQEMKIKELENSKLGNKNPLPEDTVDAQAKAATETSSLSDQVSKGQFETHAETMNENLQTLERSASSMDSTEMSTLQDSAKDLRSSLSSLENASTPEELKAALDEVRPKMASLGENISNLNTEVSAKVEGQQQTDINENNKAMETVNEQVDEESKVAENEESETTSEDPTAETPEIPVE